MIILETTGQPACTLEVDSVLDKDDDLRLVIKGALSARAAFISKESVMALHKHLEFVLSKCKD